MQTELSLPTPHHDKLIALGKNPRLPASDRPRIGEAMEAYHQWISRLTANAAGGPDTVKTLVDATNLYKHYIELDFIFDSDNDFLYR